MRRCGTLRGKEAHHEKMWNIKREGGPSREDVEHSEGKRPIVRRCGTLRGKEAHHEKMWNIQRERGPS